MTKKYDVFISYRRDGGAETAKLLRDSLTERGYSVFLDVESLRSGPFNTELYRVIEEANDFLLVLPPGALRRCAEEQDWVRKEIGYLNTYPRAAEQESTVSGLISYYMINLGQMNTASMTYQKAISKALQYAQGSTTDSATDVRYGLYNASESIKSQVADVTEPSEQLATSLAQSPFDAGALDAFPVYIRSTIKDYGSTLDFVRDNILTNDLMRAEHKTSYLNMRKEMAEIDGELMFCELNEYLLPVTNDAALEDLKTKYLPQLTTIFGSDLELSHDKAAIAGKEEALFDRYKNLLNSHGEEIERESDYWDLESLEYELEWAKAISEEYGIDTSGLQDKLQSVLDNKAEVDELREKVIERSDELSAAKKEAYQKFKPLDTDEQDVLWAKGMKFMAMYMPQEAAECYAMFAEKGSEDEKVAGTAAKRFAQRSDKLPMKGGLVVCIYEEGLPRQDVMIGDIVYELDGIPITHQDDCDEAKKDKQTFRVKVLRLKEDGEEYLDATFDAKLGRVGYRGLVTNDNGI